MDQQDGGDGKRRPGERFKGQRPRALPAGEKVINLALQGGGAHGAFTWGVLDALLEDARLTVEGISGTSAGAMNATLVAYGLQEGGRAQARAALREFWQRVSLAARSGPLQPTWFDKFMGPGRMDFSPGYIFIDNLSRVVSPYQFNPTNVNPLAEILGDMVDFSVVRSCEAIRLFLCATNVKTGKIKVFETHEIGKQHVLASACLPYLYQAVEIDGEHYWDGGYMGNPPLFPLVYGTECEDVLLVQINPLNIPDVPKTAQEIYDRVNELSFNSSLMREMRAIHFVTKLIDDGKLPRDAYKRLNVHSVNAEDVMARLGVSSKLNADWDFLSYLFELGRERMLGFLKDNYARIGVDSSTNLVEVFL